MNNVSQSLLENNFKDSLILFTSELILIVWHILSYKEDYIKVMYIQVVVIDIGNPFQYLCSSLVDRHDRNIFRNIICYNYMKYK